MKKFIAYSLLILIVILIIGLFLFQVRKSRSFQFFGNIVHRVDTDQKIVALTFDDGPEIYTNEVLDILEQKDVQATFYVIGKQLEIYPEIGKRIVNEGHELGNHSYSHPRFLRKSLTFIDQEIQTTNSLIQEMGYKGTITFRPPYGNKLFLLPWYLKKNNIETITWDVEPDTYGRTTDVLLKDTLENATSGSIILLHPFCQTCTSQRQALPLIIDALREEGYSFVTVAELLSLRNE